MEDSGIIRLYWARDERAITESQLKYGPYCGAIARNLLDREDAEECLSDTWHRAWLTMPPQRPNSLRAYLGRIVRNLSISRFRALTAAKRGGMELILEELDECVPSLESVEGQMERKELSQCLQAWLESLEPEERRLFLRRYWYGFEVNVLAKEAGISPNAMTQRLSRLRSRLKKKLEQEGLGQ